MFRRCFDPYVHRIVIHVRSSYDFVPVDRLAGAMPAPTGRMAHNQVLPGKYNTKVASRASSSPVRPGTTDHTDIPKHVYGIRMVPVYIIVSLSVYKLHRNPYGART